MIRLSYKKINLPFKYPFTISKATKTHQPALIVGLEYFGKKGYGEAPAISYYNVTVEQMIADLEAKRPFVEKFSLSDPERYWHYLHHLFPKNPFLVSALDMAAWDLFGKMKKQQVYEYWGLDTADAPVTDYTIGIDTEDMMIKKMTEKPWPVYKVKVGFDGDTEMLKTLRKHTDARLRVDANGAWTYEQAQEKLAVLADLGVELVEQPLHKDNWEGMKKLFASSALPLYADESCVSENDVIRCPHYFHGINIKLTKCSGLTPAKRMIDKARELGLDVMLGCMNESSLGTSALAQLAPLADHLDMDGPLLLAEDIAKGVQFESGKLIYAEGHGLGAAILNDVF